MRLLFAEDDQDLSRAVSALLEHAGYSVDPVFNGTDALDYAQASSYDGIILDWMMPGMSGIEVLERLRKQGNSTPCLILTARDAVPDRIVGLNAGADDYLPKPFDTGELMARIRAAARRRTHMHQAESENSVFTNGCLTIRYAEAAVFVNDKQIHLTPIEYRILSMLAMNCGKVLTHSYMISEIWGTGVETDIISLRVYMTSLRKKLSAGTDESMIRTHTSIGYQMIRL